MIYTQNSLCGCEGCKVIYVSDDGASSSPNKKIQKRLYSDLKLIKLLIKRTNEHKLNWIPYHDSMYDHYPYTLELGGAKFIVTYNGRNVELRMHWNYVEPDDYQDITPPPIPEDDSENDDTTERQIITIDYVIVSPQKRKSKLGPDVVYVRYTDDQISVMLDKFDSIKPYRIITSEWEQSVLELASSIKRYCNKFRREKTYWVDRYKETRKEHIDILEDMNGKVDDDVIEDTSGGNTLI